MPKKVQLLSFNELIELKHKRSISMKINLSFFFFYGIRHIVIELVAKMIYFFALRGFTSNAELLSSITRLQANKRFWVTCQLVSKLINY